MTHTRARLTLWALILASTSSHAGIGVDADASSGGSHSSIGIGPLSINVGSLVGHLFGHRPAPPPSSAVVETPPPTDATNDTPASTPQPSSLQPQAISIIEPFPAPLAYEPAQLQVLICPLVGSHDQFEQLQRQTGFSLRESPLPNLDCGLALIQLSSDIQARNLRNQLRRQHPDWTVDLNSRLYPLAATPRLYAAQKLQISPTSATDVHGVKIGVIDSPLSNDALLKTASITRYSALSSSDTPAQATHGNQIAMLIAGVQTAVGFSGLTSGANLSWAAATRQIDGITSTNSYLLSRAIDWMLGQRVQLLNISLGGGRDDVLAAIFARLNTKPLLVIAAAGNSGANAPATYPAAFTGVLAVTATDAVDHSYHDANHGDYITLAAPGVDVWIASDYQSGSYVSGTSFSAALVTGSLARLGAERLSHPKAELQTQLCRSAKDLGTVGKDPVYGCGLLQMSGMGVGTETMRIK